MEASIHFKVLEVLYELNVVLSRVSNIARHPANNPNGTNVTNSVNHLPK